MRSNVLTWVIQYALNNGINLRWQVENGNHWIGHQDFMEAMEK